MVNIIKLIIPHINHIQQCSPYKQTVYPIIFYFPIVVVIVFPAALILKIIILRKNRKTLKGDYYNLESYVWYKITGNYYTTNIDYNRLTV